MSIMPSLKQILNDSLIDMPKLIEANRELGFPDLEPQHKAFAYEYVACMNHRDAAVAANLPASKGIQLRRDPLIAAMISHLQERMATHSIITRDHVQAEMVELNDIAMGRIATKLVDKDGRAYEAEVHNLPVAKAVQTEMAKMTDAYKDGSGNKSDVTIVINSQALGVTGEMVLEQAPIEGQTVGEFADE